MPAEPTKSRSDRWRELKRESLLDAALVRIAAEGIDAFTMESVAEEAGVAKGTIYLYFESKRELVEEAIAYSLDPLVERVVSMLSSDAAPIDKLRGMATANLEHFDEQRHLFRVHLDGPYFPHTQAGRLRERGYRTVLAHTTRVIEEAIAERCFRPVDSAIASAVWMESLVAVILRRLRGDDCEPVADAVDTLVDLFLHGAAAR